MVVDEWHRAAEVAAANAQIQLRELAHVTRGSGLEFVSDVYAVIANLYDGLASMSQSIRQLDAFLEQQLGQGVVRADRATDDPAAMVASCSVQLDRAAALTWQANEALQSAQNAIGNLGNVRSDDEGAGE